MLGCQTTSGRRDAAPTYLVRIDKGDTLANIASQYDTTWQEIAALNGIKDARALKVGRILRIRPGPGGLVAGAELAPASARAAISRHQSTPSTSRGAFGDTAAADEFTVDDLPAEGRRKDSHDDSEGSGNNEHTGRGLLFGGENRAGLYWPLHGELSSVYGRRGRGFHYGIDIRARTGTNILAAASGIVEYAGRKRGYGKVVIVRHARFKTLYAHMSRIHVDAGEQVAAGTVVGAVGVTGNASGPHLHFEVQTRAGKALNPLSVLPNERLISSAH